MKEVLEPLTRVAGVRQVAVVSADGVPAMVLERSGRGGEFLHRAHSEAAKLTGQRIDPTSFGALAVGWAEELARSVAPLAWDAPWRIVLVASQGTLIIQQGPGAIVLVVVEPGTPPETLAIPLDGAVARMERLLRSLGRHADTQEAPSLVDGAGTTDVTAAARLDVQKDTDRAARGGQRTPKQHPHGDFAEDR